MDTTQCSHIFITMPHQSASEWAQSTAESWPGPVFNWAPFEAHGPEAQIVGIHICQAVTAKNIQDKVQ